MSRIASVLEMMNEAWTENIATTVANACLMSALRVSGKRTAARAPSPGLAHQQ